MTVLCGNASFLAGVAAKHWFKQTVNYHINTVLSSLQGGLLNATLRVHELQGSYCWNVHT